MEQCSHAALFAVVCLAFVKHVLKRCTSYFTHNLHAEYMFLNLKQKKAVWWNGILFSGVYLKEAV